MSENLAHERSIKLYIHGGHSVRRCRGLRKNRTSSMLAQTFETKSMERSKWMGVYTKVAHTFTTNKYDSNAGVLYTDRDSSPQSLETWRLDVAL